MMDKRWDYVLFDLDGTLTDSAEGILNCAEYALERLGKPVPAREQLRPMLGPPLSQTFHSMFGLDEQQAELGIRYYRERYSTVGLFENRPFEGIDKMLAGLKSAGLRMGVATSKPEPFSRRILERFGLDKYFETITGCGLDGSLDTKAQVIEEALRRLGAEDKSRAVMVGDRCYDISGAKEAGLECIGVSWGFAEEGELEQYGAIAVADSYSDLEELLTGAKDL